MLALQQTERLEALSEQKEYSESLLDEGADLENEHYTDRCMQPPHLSGHSNEDLAHLTLHRIEAIPCAAPLAPCLAELLRAWLAVRPALECRGCAQGQGPEEALPPGGDAGAQGDAAVHGGR